MKICKKRLWGGTGFTLSELLVVVAIIGVLVATSIPVFSGQLEKARRAVDMSNARSILSALKTGYASGAIEFTSDQTTTRSGKVYACVTVAVEINEMQICASTNVKIMGATATTQLIENYIKSCGLGNLRVKSRTLETDGGWDFYTVILYSDGSSRIASGTLHDDQVEAWNNASGHFENNAANWRYRDTLSTIEQAMTKK